MLKRLALAAILCGLLCQPALADELTTAKRADINRLMETTGSAKLGLQMAEALSQNAIKTIKANRCHQDHRKHQGHQDNPDHQVHHDHWDHQVS